MYETEIANIKSFIKNRNGVQAATALADLENKINGKPTVKARLSETPVEPTRKPFAASGGVDTPQVLADAT